MTKGRIDRPASLSQLARYQDGAIVSQTLLKTASGTVTAFAFDAGEGLSEHQVPSEALVLILEGRAAVTVGGVEHAVGEGEVLRLPAGVPHALHAPEKFRMLLVIMREA